jgi:archaellum component FlaF (FlaF/FlaG flagellin family)
MNLPKLLVTGLFSTTLIITLAACSTSEPAQTNNIVPESSASATATTAPILSEEDNQKAVAARYQTFLDSVYALTSEDMEAVGTIYDQYETEPDSEEKKKVIAQFEEIFPEFAIIDTTDLTPDEKTAIYGVIFTTGMLSANSGTTAIVPADAITITGETASTSTSSLQVSVDGEIVPTSPSEAADDVTFTLIDGEWFIDPDIYLAMMNN